MEDKYWCEYNVFQEVGPSYSCSGVENGDNNDDNISAPDSRSQGVKNAQV
jgi:hypothetical protein